jgi:hypothetical protein
MQSCTDEVIVLDLSIKGADMDVGPRKRKALNIGQLLDYLRSVGVEKPESLPIHFPDDLPAVLAVYDEAEGMLILSDLAESPLTASSYLVGESNG